MKTPVPIRAVISAFVFLSIALQWIIGYIVQSIFNAVATPFMSKERREDICSLMFRYISWVGVDLINPFWWMHLMRPLKNFPESEDGSPTKVLFMLNHTGTMDPFCSLHAILPRDCSWICKDELFRVPIGGKCLSYNGDIPVMFKNKREGNETVKGSVPAMMEKVKEKLRRGRCIAVFPEGTRNKDPDGPLQPFKNGFFRLAIDEDAWIIPLAISGTHRAWPQGTKLMDFARIYLSWGDPIDVRKYDGDIDHLREDVWEVMTSLRDGHPDRVGITTKEKAE